ncbi:iron reductase domain protein [Trichocladium antarcticum]|uniref:Iron reductase domain protein n=1 Tax=Trichocladium antarcticum TaxID=1450529 RepID=A0AAN6UCV9_9PEZI|nr:iron reductase domain protein [Trichocladium antarcticum]
MRMGPRAASGRARLRLSGWLFGLALSTLAQIHLATAQTAVSTLFVPNSNTTIAINLPPGSDDINFYLSAPDLYQYVAIGFGSSMSNALMLVMYASADRKGVTVSPRSSTGLVEPVWNPDINITLHPSSTLAPDSLTMIANGTCHDCLALAALPRTTAAPMIFAVGPAVQTHPLSSDDRDARLRRHIGHGQFTIDLVHATGGSSFPALPSPPPPPPPPPNATAHAAMAPGSPREDSTVRGPGAAHGILYAIVALAIAPFDALVAAVSVTRRGRGWAWLGAITGAVYFAFVLGAMVPGVVVSRELVLTRQFRTPHQVLGLITVVMMTIVVGWGGVLAYVRRSAAQRGQEPPENTRLLGTIHQWIGRLIWVLFLVNVGLGLKLSERHTLFILGFLALALGVLVILLPVHFCLWRCSKRQKGKEEDPHELNIYNHS